MNQPLTGWDWLAAQQINPSTTGFQLPNYTVPGMQITAPQMDPSFAQQLRQGWGNLTGLEKFGVGLGTAQSLAGMWGSLQQLGLARDQFRTSRNFANANLANQTQSYNTALEGRAKARAAMQGDSAASVDAYLAAHRLPDRKI